MKYYKYITLYWNNMSLFIFNIYHLLYFILFIILPPPPFIYDYYMFAVNTEMINTEMINMVPIYITIMCCHIIIIYHYMLLYNMLNTTTICYYIIIICNYMTWLILRLNVISAKRDMIDIKLNVII